MSHPQIEPAVGLADILVTRELAARGAPPSDPVAEVAALHAIARKFAGEPSAALDALVDAALRLCNAGSAGVSLLSEGADGKAVFEWIAMAGAYAAYKGGTTPRDFSPCGATLDLGTPQLFDRPARFYEYFKRAAPPELVEGLVVPFRSGPVEGTIWVASHDHRRKFTLEDARILTSLGNFTAAASATQSTHGRLKRAERHDRESAARLRQVFESVKDYAIFAIDPAGRVTDWNAGAQHVFGYEESEIVGRIADVLWTPEDRAAGAPEHERATASATGCANDERWHQRKGGGRFFASGVLTPIRDDHGTLTGYTKVCRDVTERKQAEHHASSILESITDAFVSLDREWRFTYVNAEAERLLLRRREDLLGRTLWEEFPRCHGTGFEREYRRAMGEGVVVRFVEFYPQPLDRWYDVRVFPSAAGLSIYFQDVNKRLWAENALRESESRLQLAVAIAQMGTFLIDLRTDAVTVNEAGRAIYGWTPDQPVTFAGVQSHFHPDDRERVMRSVGDALTPDGPGEFEVEQRIVRTDGGTRWIRVRGRAYFETVDAARTATRCIGTYLDITGQKESERQRDQLLAAERAARAEAERNSRMKDEFLTTLSHELRTPLSAMIGWAKIIQSDMAKPADVRHGLEVIQRNARAQSQIIEDLLDMNRIISGRVRLDVKRIDLAAVIGAAVETARHAAVAKGIRLQTHFEQVDDVPFVGDPDRLQQVLWNLLSNAIKFTGNGGHVRVALRKPDAHLEITVSDTGEGIRPEFLPFVFDRFRQADSSTTRRHGGLGVGLSIAKQLVELHGGSVRVASPGPGQGASFTVYLPISPTVTELAASTPSAGQPAINPEFPDTHRRIVGTRVIFLDDEADTRDMIRRILEDAGVIVTAVSTADEAVELLRRETYDVLVSDIGMPDEDGYSLIRRVRALSDAANRDIPAVALTAYARVEDRVKAIEAGYQIHVAKPVEPSELLTVLSSLVARPR